MSHDVIIVGAGMGGLTSAIRLAQRGVNVRVLEARRESGGLASSVEFGGFVFDAGPYILLDRPGLEWAFRSLGLELEDHVTLKRIKDVYEVVSTANPTVRIYSDLQRTADELDHRWKGAGSIYKKFVSAMTDARRNLSPLLHVSKPGPVDLARDRMWTRIPFLLQSLGSLLSQTKLPQPVIEAIAIWTHIAGQSIDEAPSPMGFVPSLIHDVGAYYPVGGIASIPKTLTNVAVKEGVKFDFDRKVRAITLKEGRVNGVETEDGEFVTSDAVISNHHGIGTYLRLVSETSQRLRNKLSKLPLQSPGSCAYLAIRGNPRPPYLKFFLPGDGELCRLLVSPVVIDDDFKKGDWFPARLVLPMRHEWGFNVEQSREYLERCLAESWWRDDVEEYRVLATRTPPEWETQFNLYRVSMNPVMTAGFMRAGRLAHRSPYVDGLYLTGSSTHPGQWVSFCAISGIHAANDLLEDIK